MGSDIAPMLTAFVNKYVYAIPAVSFLSLRY